MSLCRLAHARAGRAHVVDPIEIFPVKPVFHEIDTGFDPLALPAFRLNVVKDLPAPIAEPDRLAFHVSPHVGV